MTSPTPVSVSIESLFPGCAATACSRIADADADPEPEEIADVEQAVVKRRQEFIAGRICARQALDRLGVPPGPLRKLPDGSIAWPEGITGSVSHSEIWSGAAVVRLSDAAGIGLDMESSARIGQNLWRRILTPEEHAWLARRPQSETRQWASLVFSAKEALYKCIKARLTGRIGFMDAVIVPNPPANTFAVRLNETAAAQLPRNLHLEGRFFFSSGEVFTGLVLS
jgi:4'-phosphopantetheinyl transferase EntD